MKWWGINHQMISDGSSQQWEVIRWREVRSSNKRAGNVENRSAMKAEGEEMKRRRRRRQAGGNEWQPQMGIRMSNKVSRIDESK